MTKSKIVIVAIIVICSTIAFFSLDGLLTPYVSFDKAAGGEHVQIFGTLVKSVPVQNTANGFTFVMEDEDAARLTVLHQGVKPLNFDHADSVAAIGAFNKESNIFIAERILVKCPSKYTKENNQ